MNEKFYNEGGEFVKPDRFLLRRDVAARKKGAERRKTRKTVKTSGRKLGRPPFITKVKKPSERLALAKTYSCPICGAELMIQKNE